MVQIGSYKEEAGTRGKTLATGRGGSEMTDVAGHQGTETKYTGISEHIGKNTIKIMRYKFSPTILTKIKRLPHSRWQD